MVLVFLLRACALFWAWFRTHIGHHALYGMWVSWCSIHSAVVGDGGAVGSLGPRNSSWISVESSIRSLDCDSSWFSKTFPLTRFSLCSPASSDSPRDLLVSKGLTTPELKASWLPSKVFADENPDYSCDHRVSSTHLNSKHLHFASISFFFRSSYFQYTKLDYQTQLYDLNLQIYSQPPVVLRWRQFETSLNCTHHLL